MYKMNMRYTAIILLLSINMLIPCVMWRTAQEFVAEELKAALGTVSLQDASATQSAYQYFSASGKERDQLIADGERTIEFAGYSYSGPKYIRDRATKKLFPFAISAFLVGIITAVLLLCQFRHNERRLLRQNLRQTELETQLQTVKSNRERLLEDIGLYEGNLYHQMKTPLTSLQLCLEQLARENCLDSHNRKIYEAAELQLRKLSRLVTLFLRDQRLSSNKLKFHYKPAALDSMIEDAVRQLQQQAQFRGVKISRTIPEEDFFLHCDETWLSECVVTLIENAIEHAPENGLVEISLQQEQGEYRLQVLSPGVELEPERLSRIFDRYFSGSSGHFGIGLHMARMIAENHHGHITAYPINRDQPNQSGVCFDLVLPILDGSAAYPVTKM